MEEKRRRLMGKSGGVPTIVPPTPKTGLIYNGSAQELVDAGSTDIGVLIYSTDNENWSSSIPTGTNAGSYTVYYKVQGFEAEYVNCSIAKASRTISFTTKPSSVNANASKTVAATPSAGSGDGSITYTSGSTSIATVSGSSVTGVAKGSATIYATIGEGTNYLSASTSYTISVVYPTGVYAFYSDGSIKSSGSATSSAIGVLIVNSSRSLLLNKTETTRYWDSACASNGQISGVATAAAGSAPTNYAGPSNTTTMNSKSGCEAAKYCRSCTKTVQGTTKYGFFGGGVEQGMVGSNFSSINTMLSKIGGTSVASGTTVSVMYWVCAQQTNYAANNAITWYYNSGSKWATQKKSSAQYRVRAFFEI